MRELLAGFRLRHESASWSTCSLRRLLYLCALGSRSGGFLFRQRLLCALILSVVRRLLRLSWLRVLQLLPELLRLWLGRLLSALVEASILRRVLWRMARARVGRTPLARWWPAWRRMAWPSLTLSLDHDPLRLSRQRPRDARRRNWTCSDPHSPASIKKAEEEADQACKSADWEKNQTRIREYLESLSPPKRLEVEIAALTASRLDEDRFRRGSPYASAVNNSTQKN